MTRFAIRGLLGRKLRAARIESLRERKGELRPVLPEPRTTGEVDDRIGLALHDERDLPDAACDDLRQGGSEPGRHLGPVHEQPDAERRTTHAQLPISRMTLPA